MSTLQNEIDKLKTLKESYSELSKKILDTQAVLTELNHGKKEMVDALAMKNVQSSTDKTLVEIASDIRSIAQSPITIDGGEMYEKQLFGAPTDKTLDYSQPNSPVWNLYQVMSNLLSDGRFSNYGGIILVEYDMFNDSVDLSSAGAGGCYLTSDGAFFDYDNTYTWEDIDSTKMNRWVAYFRAQGGANFNAPEGAINIYIGRKVGVLSSNQKDNKLREVIVFDGGEVLDTDFTTPLLGGNSSLVFRGIQNNSKTCVINNSSSHKAFKIIIDGGLISYPLFIYKSNEIGNYSIYISKNTKFNAVMGNNSIRALTYNESLHDGKDAIIHDIHIEEGVTWGNIGIIHSCEMTNVDIGTLTIHGIKTLYSPIFSEELHTNMDFHSKIIFKDLETFECSPFIAKNSNGLSIYATHIIAKKALIKDFSMAHVNFHRLIDLEIGGAVNNIYMPCWKFVDFIGDAEKVAELNNNIREHIAAKVSDGNGILTFTISAELYAKLEQETLDAFAAKNWIVAGA